MKRTLSLVLALVMVLGSFSTVFAAGTSVEEKAGAFLKEKEVLVGNAEGNLMLGEGLKRQDAVILLSKLMGEFDEAQATTGTPTYKDVRDKFYAPFLAWAQANGTFVGHNNDKFGFGEFLTAQEYASVLLRVLGYEVEWKETLAKATELGLLADVTAENSTKITRGQMAVMTVNALDTKVNGSDETLAEQLEIEMPQPAKLEVKEIKANSAKSFQVTFNKAVEKTEDIKFAVARGTVATTVTTTWNEEKTVATLTAAAKLPEGKFVVTVTEGEVELAKQELEITQEKVTDVEFDSDMIVRINEHQGTIGYIVRNQYGENITNSALGRSLTFQTSTDTQPVRDPENGVITIQHGTAVVNMNQLKDLKVVVLTVRDASTGFVVTKSLEVSSTISTVQNVVIKGIVDEKGNDLTDKFTYSTTKAYYLDVEVTDMNGKAVKSWSILSALVGNPADNRKILDVTATHSGITISPERHPERNHEMAYRVQLTPPAPEYDTPVTFMAVAPYTGKNATFTATLKRIAKVEKFTMQSPVEIASINKAVEIPFEAFDQNGEKVTAYEDLNGMINFGSAAQYLQFVRQSDGSAKLFGTFPSKSLYYVTATVNGSLAGSFSQIAIDVKDLGKATIIEPLRHARAYVPNATWGSLRVTNFTVRDQYDRKVDLRTDNLALGYSIKVTSMDPSIMVVNNGATTTISGDQTLQFKAVAPGTVTIKYELLGTGEATDPVATTVAYVIPNKDVKSVELTAQDKEIAMLQKNALYYTAGSTTYLVNDSLTLENWLTFVGKTASGDAVRLANAWYTSSDSRFTASSGVQANGVFGANEHTASTVITGHFNNGVNVLKATTTVKASDAKPVPTEVYTWYQPSARRLGTIYVNNDVVDVTVNDFNRLFNGKSVYFYTKSAADPGALAPAVFGASSQFGEHVLDRVTVNNKVDVNGNNLNTGTISVNPDTGVITASAITANDEFVLTGIASNGQSKVMTIRIKANTGNVSELAAQNAIVAYEALSLSTAADIDTAIADDIIVVAGGKRHDAQTAISALSAGSVKQALEIRYANKKAAVDSKKAAITAVVTKATAGELLLANLTAVGVTAGIEANLSAYEGLIVAQNPTTATAINNIVVNANANNIPAPTPVNYVIDVYQAPFKALRLMNIDGVVSTFKLADYTLKLNGTNVIEAEMDAWLTSGAVISSVQVVITDNELDVRSAAGLTFVTNARDTATVNAAVEKVPATLNPVKDTDTNVIDMVVAAINDNTVVVTVKTSSNNSVAANGDITYTAETGNVVFTLTKGAASQDVTVSVVVPDAE